MTRTSLRLALVGSGLALVVACGGGGGSAVADMTRLGTTFQQAFAQGPNDVPIDISNADLTVQLTQEPFEL